MTDNITDIILKKLQNQEKEEGKLPLLLEFYKKLTQVQASARKRSGKLEPTISSDAIQSRIVRGQPLVSFDELSLDWPLIRDVFTRVITVYAGYPQLFGDIPEKLRNPTAGRYLTKKAVKAWYAGKSLPPALLDGINDNLMRSIIQSTMQPFLTAHGQALIGKVDEKQWYQGYCPICGGIPDIAYLEKEVGARWLKCSRCDSEWQFNRLGCPYCRYQDQSSHTYFSSDDDLYRLYVCDHCKSYLKAIDLRKTDADTMLPLERIYTIDLDKQAIERGYHPGQASKAD